MAGIDWSLARAPDIVGNALQYRQAGIAEDVAANERNALQASRLRQEGREVAQDQRLAAQDQRQITQDQQKAFSEAVTMLGGFGSRVRTPADLESLKTNPVFQQVYARAAATLGFKTPIEAITLDQVHQFNTEASKIQGVSLGGGGYGTFDPNSGEFKTIREPVDKPIIIGNGATAYDPETGRPVYTNPKTFAPPRAAAGGGAGASLPPGYAPR